MEMHLGINQCKTNIINVYLKGFGAQLWLTRRLHVNPVTQSRRTKTLLL